MMDAASPFAQNAHTPESVIAQVRRQLAHDAGPNQAISSDMLDGIVDRAVRELWGSRVKTFVPVLAQRQARAALLELKQALVDPGHPIDYTVARRGPAPAGYDIVSLDGDILDLDEQDVVRL